MKIDWFTVIAQVINFAILVWLLKRLLYKPILKAIETREKKITSQLIDAEHKKSEARIERDEYLLKNKNFEAEKEQLMNETIVEANAIRNQLLIEARNDFNILKRKQEASLKELKNNINKEYKQNVKRIVFSITRKALADLASVKLEELAVISFIKQLQELKEDEKNQFVKSFKYNKKPVLVQSSFDLTDELQNKIKIALGKILGKETPLQFKEAPELISGIEVSANGYKLAWSIAEYIDSLENSL